MFPEEEDEEGDLEKPTFDFDPEIDDCEGWNIKKKTSIIWMTEQLYE